MKALIIEDEELTADRLEKLLSKHAEIELLDKLYSVNSAIKWFQKNDVPDLVFLDIQLGDGTGFDILEKIDAFPHIIFTTAYDQYAIEAFKYNSIDYLLKPVKEEDLTKAINKLSKMAPPTQLSTLVEEMKLKLEGGYKQKFLVKLGHKYHSFNVDEIAYFYSEDGETYIQTKEDRHFIIDYTLDSLERVLDPKNFFRINRHMIVTSTEINAIESYFNNRLSLEVTPKFKETIVVSRDRVRSFKQWLGE